MTDDDGRQEVKGMLFPAGVDVPEDTFVRTKLGGDTVWIFGIDGYIDVAHQCGLEGIDTDIVAHGVETTEKTRTRDDGSQSSSREEFMWVAARSEVTIDGETYAAVGSIDSTSNSLEDAGSTAETRATKRAIRRALNIRRVGAEPEEPRAKAGGNDNGW